MTDIKIIKCTKTGKNMVCMTIKSISGLGKYPSLV